MQTPRSTRSMRVYGALAVASALLLTACGGGRDESTASAAGSGATETTAPATTETPTTSASSSSAPALSGSIAADGSSTVAPFATAAAEEFQTANSGVQVTVGTSGTGGGFEKFCNGETDISNASRGIKDEEKAACDAKGIVPVEFLVANDGLSVIASKDNDWVDCLTVDQLKKIWGPESKASSWKDIDPSFPDEKLALYGPGTDSGTFDFFTKSINGEEGASRSDYTASEDDNVTVEGVAGEKGGLGYFGFSYYEENQDKLKLIAVDSGSGCVAPSVETVQDGTYAPLSRPLYMYVKQESFTRPEVQAFIEYVIGSQSTLAATARFVPLTAEQETTAKSELDKALATAG